MPWVASEACWRKTVVVVVEGVGVGLGIWQMSMGMERRWQAKIVFIMGMYWWARSEVGETVRMKIRDWRVPCDCWVESRFVCGEGSFAEGPLVDSAKAMVSRLMYDSARVRAPAILVEVLLETSSGRVALSNLVRLERSSSSTSRKGRYLLLEEWLRVFVVSFDLGPFGLACCEPLILSLFVVSLS